MAYRLPAERTRLELEDGPTIEVMEITTDAIYMAGVGLASTFLGSRNVADLRKLYAFFVEEAQPTWEIVDHRGPIVPTAEGMLRLPVELAMAMIDRWTETFTRTSAVDEVIPPGPARKELNRRLRKARAA